MEEVGDSCNNIYSRLCMYASAIYKIKHQRSRSFLMIKAFTVDLWTLKRTENGSCLGGKAGTLILERGVEASPPH